MDTYCGVSEDQSDATRQQKRHYYLLSELQTLVKDLSFQQHLSYTTLNDLAQALIDGTVYEIVQGLLDIQHLMDVSGHAENCKMLTVCDLSVCVCVCVCVSALKQDLVRKQKQALQTCKSHNLAVLKTNQRAKTEALDQRVKEEQRMMDEKVVSEMMLKESDTSQTSQFHHEISQQNCF
uniref:DiGeorge syndrome critical region gene 6 n=1 Tax=Sinocyclocheilus rhinocerous TaxID=307959 RepID=A0A673MFE5_9TELE